MRDEKEKKEKVENKVDQARCDGVAAGKTDDERRGGQLRERSVE